MVRRSSGPVLRWSIAIWFLWLIPLVAFAGFLDPRPTWVTWGIIIWISPMLALLALIPLFVMLTLLAIMGDIADTILAKISRRVD